MAHLSVRQTYAIHGVGLLVSGDVDAVALLDGRLAHFRVAGQEGYPITVELCGVDTAQDHVVSQPPGRTRPVFDLAPGHSIVYYATDQLYTEYEGVRGICHPNLGEVRLSFLRHNPRSRWLAVHTLFTILFVETLKRRGLFSVHAAGLSFDGHGLVLAGASGCGKTTLTLAMVRAGLGFLGDDILFLDRRGGELLVLAFPDYADVAEDVALWFPEMRQQIPVGLSPRGRKHGVRAEALYGTVITRACRPRVLVFPSIATADHSTVIPMERRDALKELASNILLTESRSSQAHLTALRTLTTESRCYRLATGRDFDRLPALMRGLLQP